MTQNILILGGAGFIGSSLAIGLKQRHPDWKITCLDNLRRRGSELNLSRFKACDIQFIHGDIRFPSDLDSSIFDVEKIIDCSAEPSVLAGFTSPQYMLHTNLLGTINILELAREIKADLLFLSTSRVYPIEALKSIHLTESDTRFDIAKHQETLGISELGIAENFPLHGARSLYGTTKLASELLIEEYRQAYGIRAIINRCGVVAGSWQMGKVDQGVFTLWVAAHYFQKSLSYIGYGGTGKQVRDVLNVRDLLELIDVQFARFSELDGEILNVGGGVKNSLSLWETTQLCQAITGNTIPIHPVPEERPGDVPLFITDSSRAIAQTGWKPKLNPRETLEEIYQWISENEKMVRAILA
ncbi:NAD-dependent epimerase/dehydratase family protein [Lusitaniella coriacea LEGE 07157]|uniref:NAD-dependent epimerase/dehydratase family protein n=1 Tax=Lusitaniella coriacea LEGE 07157 TaxID=945747 RepID=A0A8J7DVT9_9CYAN|nr:NAD-dependent epimerase/dehydratase family protein [Lusitaniella coriacea]MBE9115979.1 NAD-dependent epimerase/dehydratase family protein [Lusitaniella coriacea LEGE 07157]